MYDCRLIEVMRPIRQYCRAVLIVIQDCETGRAPKVMRVVVVFSRDAGFKFLELVETARALSVPARVKAARDIKDPAQFRGLPQGKGDGEYHSFPTMIAARRFLGESA